MKSILLLSFLLSLPSFGSVCEELKSYKGRYMLGNCKVELHLCEDSSSALLPSYLDEKDTEKHKFWQGDLLVTSKDGKSIYVPLYSPDAKLTNTSITFEENKREMAYSYQDRISDPISGFKERYDVKFDKRKKRIEVTLNNSVYSRKNPIRSLFFNDIKINCAE